MNRSTISNHHDIKTWLFMAIFLFFLGATGCDASVQVDGSYEESSQSGRTLTWQTGQDTHRYFRLHLRQFEDSIGGTFETFDMSSYTSFRQVPLLMDTPLSLYYCSRIDYGYIRGDMAYITFTDHEQRQWTLSLELEADGNLAGKLERPTTGDPNQYCGDEENYLPEDVAYFYEKPSEHQIVFQPMDKNSDKSLDCLYYFKKTTLDFILPANLSLEKPYRLAIAGVPVLHRIDHSGGNAIQEILSATLDNCSVQSNSKRTIQLRENPFAMSGDADSRLFFATAFVYYDTAENNHWDANFDPIVATLKDQVLLFYEEAPSSSIYGNQQDGKTLEQPVIPSSVIDPAPGWHVYHYETTSNQDSAYAVISSISQSPVSTLSLIPLSGDGLTLDNDGCYIQPQEAPYTPCSSIFPVLLQ